MSDLAAGIILESDHDASLKGKALAQPPDEGRSTPRRARRGYEPSGDAAPVSPERAVGAGGTYGAATTPPSDSRRSASKSSAARRRAGDDWGGASATEQPVDRRFRGALVRTVAGTIVPGLGLLGTRAHRSGLLILGLLVAGTGAVAFTVLRNPTFVAGSALRSERVFTLGVVVAALAMIWVSIIVGTYLISRPRRLTQTQRAIGAGVVGTLSLLVSAPLAVASAYAFETAALSGGLFQSESESRSGTRPTLDAHDPWANKPRVNLLLLGGDSGEGRDTELGVRTDTMMLASIDTATGDTLIVQLPRNLQGPPFPERSPLYYYYPYGFDNGSTSMLNAVWQDVPNTYPDLFTNTDYPGADALKWAVEGVTDLPVDYFVMVNMDGLVELVDAMGGVRVNVNFPIAMGGSDEGYDCGAEGWIPEGPNQRLDGRQAMWYARSRCNTPGADYGRMQRQSCLVNAVIDQADPARMATRYEGLAKATGNMVETDIPQEHLPAMVDLASRVQQGHTVQRIAFTEETPGFDSAYPDFDLMHQMIADAIAGMSETPSPSAEATEQPGQQPTAEPNEPAPPATTEAPTEPAEPTDTGWGEPTWEQTGWGEPTEIQSTNPVEDVGDACDYRHEEPAGGWYIPETVPVYTPEPSETTEPPR